MHLTVRGIEKRFPGVHALRGVDLDVRAGEVVAVIGENGAGKSTLMKILAGVHRADAGTVTLDGKAIDLHGIAGGLGHGIALIHQELNLADNLDVAANVFLGREPTRFGRIDSRRIHREASVFLAEVGLDVPSTTMVDRLSIGQRQLVEIAKALSTEARILLMDEPTSSLSLHEADQLHRVVDGLRRDGRAVVFISHRLGEVKHFADRVVVLRDGANAGELTGDDITPDRMASLMVGRDLVRDAARDATTDGDVVLSVEGLAHRAHPEHPVDLEVRRGEIVGIAGLVGAGRTELLRALFGIDPPRAGIVSVGGVRSRPTHPLDAIRAGIALVPEERRAQGLLLEDSVRTNLNLAALRRDQRRGFVDHDAARRLSRSMIERLAIRTASDRHPAGLLSGGNQQKVVLGRWLALDPRVFLLDEPTRGVDIGAKGEIYRILRELADAGTAILFASSEMDEVIRLSDRVLVMHDGRMMGALIGDEITEERIITLATGRERAA